jgi:hypothetical protein
MMVSNFEAVMIKTPCGQSECEQHMQCWRKMSVQDQKRMHPKIAVQDTFASSNADDAPSGE